MNNISKIDKDQESEIVNLMECLILQDSMKHTECLREFWFMDVPIMFVTHMIMLAVLFGFINYISGLGIDLRDNLNVMLPYVVGAFFLGWLLYQYPRRISRGEARKSAEFEIWRRQQ